MFLKATPKVAIFCVIVMVVKVVAMADMADMDMSMVVVT